jgi:hypothetical protein
MYTHIHTHTISALPDTHGRERDREEGEQEEGRERVSTRGSEPALKNFLGYY